MDMKYPVAFMGPMRRQTLPIFLHLRNGIGPHIFPRFWCACAKLQNTRVVASCNSRSNEY